MKVLIKHVLRNLKENKKRTFLIMLSLIFTGMFITIIFSAFNLLTNLQNVMLNALTSGYDYVITNKDGSPITKSQEDAVLNDVTKVGLYSSFGYIKINDKDYQMYMYATDTSISYKVGLFSQGNDSGIELKENEIILAEKELNDLNLKIGDKITFYNSKGNPYNLIIAKTIKSDMYLQYSKGDYYAFATNLETYKKINETNELKNDIYYISLNKKLTDEEAKQFEDKCEEVGLKINKSDTDVNVMSSLIGQLVPILVIIILLLAVIVYFVNNSFVKVILNERIPIMGTFRSVGATSKMVDRILLLEMALYGFISGLFGSIVGFLISRWLINSLMIPYCNELVAGYDFSFLIKTIDNSAISTLSISIVCITIFQIFLSIKDIMSSGKISVKDCIFSKYNDMQVYDVENLLFGIAFFIIGILSILLSFKITTFWGVLGLISIFISISKLLPFIYKFIFQKIKINNPVNKMACSNLYNSKLQMGSSVILCILISIILLLISFAKEINDTNNYTINTKHFDSYINILNSTDEDINDISFVDGVESIATLYTATPVINDVYIANNKVSSITFLATDNAETLLKTNTEFTGIDLEQLKNLKNNEIILSSDFAKKYGINVGDYIYLNFMLKREHFNVDLPIYVKVVGVHNYLLEDCFISIDLMNTFDKLDTLSCLKELYIISNNNIDVTANINKLFEEREISDEAKSLNEFIDDTNSETTNTYIIIVMACIGLSVIVLICITNNQMICFLQRKKEFATLNSICMSRKQIKKMITIEIMLSYLISFLTAIIYYIVISKIVSIVINSNLKASLLGIVVVFIVTTVAMYFVSLKIRKNVNNINIIDEIKYE